MKGNIQTWHYGFPTKMSPRWTETSQKSDVHVQMVGCKSLEGVQEKLRLWLAGQKLLHKDPYWCAAQLRRLSKSTKVSPPHEWTSSPTSAGEQLQGRLWKGNTSRGRTTERHAGNKVNWNLKKKENAERRPILNYRSRELSNDNKYSFKNIKIRRKGKINKIKWIKHHMMIY